MELGHLATKPDDVADSKKICRLFGAMVDKLESRHTTFLNAAVRKVTISHSLPLSVLIVCICSAHRPTSRSLRHNRRNHVFHPG